MGNFNTSPAGLWTRPEPIISFRQSQDQDQQNMQYQDQRNMKYQDQRNMEDFDQYNKPDEMKPERLTIKIGDKTFTIRSDNRGRFHLNKLMGSGLVYLTSDNGQIYVHGNRSGRIALQPDKRGRHYMDFDDNGKVVLQSHQY